MIEIVPVKTLDVHTTVPGSKYVANRVLMMAALADGTSILHNVPENEDIIQMMDVLGKCGITILIDGTTIHIEGGNPSFPKKINVRDSGTLFRFMTAVTATKSTETIIDGTERIRQRPILPLLKSLSDLGASYSSENGHAPVTISGPLKGGRTSILGNLSSQFISALLIAGPIAKDDVQITVRPPLLSKRYIDLTVDCMSAFGADVDRKGYESFIIKKGTAYHPQDFSIPGDWSSANYFFAAAALLGGSVSIERLDDKKGHGESGFLELLSHMGCLVKKEGSRVTVKGTGFLHGIDVDMSDMPDAVQTLAILAPFADGPTRMRNIGHLTHKESDRIEDTAKELRKLGIFVKTTLDSITIDPSKVSEGIINPHGDHRMAMAAGILGMKVSGIKIKDPSSVNKSFPDFWEKLKGLGAEIKDV